MRRLTAGPAIERYGRVQHNISGVRTYERRNVIDVPIDGRVVACKRLHFLGSRVGGE